MRAWIGLLWFIGTGAAVCAADLRPNILWITAEDMSPTLGCYGDDYTTTPHLDRLAEQSVRYTHAFATAPVCSPSRSCLITGCYAPSLGTQQMRSAFLIPEFMQGFPSLLRKHGYYTTNNVKTDYNTGSSPRIIRASWDDSTATAHWRNRAGGSPFLSVFNLMTSHQSRSMAWSRDRFREEVQSQLSAAEIHDPDRAPLPPYYPDTLVTRRVIARFYDCVTVMDKQVGEILRQLEEDGLAEDTIVFFYSDHGSGLPRHKRVLLDSGMHVPLLVRFPRKFAHLAPVGAGGTTDRLVSFVDFAPTVLDLAGVAIPAWMQGVPFLGPHTPAPRRYVYGHRDRIDEALDVARSVRDRRYLYVRNFMPHLGHHQPSWWPDMGEIDHEFYRVADDVEDPAIRQFVSPTRPAEELYDCAADPLNLHNLVDSSDHQATLERFRQALRAHIRDSRDVGFLPEAVAWELLDGRTAWELSRDDSDRTAPLGGESFGWVPYLAAEVVARGESLELESQRRELLRSDRPSVRYWGVIALQNQRSLTPGARRGLHEVLHDASPAVRIAAAHALASRGEVDAGLPVLTKALGDEDLTVVLQATRSIELLGRKAQSAAAAMRQVSERAERLQATSAPATFELSNEQDLAMFCSFSANNFLKRLQEGAWVPLLAEPHRSQWTGYAAGQARFVEDGVQLQSTGNNLWIAHASVWENFELTVEVKMPEGEYNSGIGFRCHVAESGRPRGYQCEIAESATGGLFAIDSGGWIWPRGTAEQAAFHDHSGDAFRSGKWNHLRVRCEGDHIQIWVNGVLATDVHDDRHSQGRIALQHHGRGGAHAFRALVIRPLNGS